MPPDFNQKTIDALAKRAGFKCSNPDCRVSTVGPNSDPQKATIIGEAAHIYGARPGSPRYQASMSDFARAEISNGIWLCRNCHKKIDRDGEEYKARTLFNWREMHERHIAKELGTPGELAKIEADWSELREFDDYPPIIKRIIVDHTTGWQWRLTAELMRYLNAPEFRRLRDLRDGVYVRPTDYKDGREVVSWLRRLAPRMATAIGPLEKVLVRLNASWGSPGEPGNVSQIHHSCKLLRDSLAQIIDLEEELHFAVYDREFDRLVGLFKNALGNQLREFETIPEMLDKALALSMTNHGGTPENPYVLERVITLELPKGWARDVKREFKRAEKLIEGGYRGRAGTASSGCTWILVTGVVIFILLILL